MKTIVVLLFCINAAVLVWTRVLPRENMIARETLSIPVAQEGKMDKDRTIGQMELQVVIGRGYRQLYDDNKTVINMMPFVLGLNMAFAFLVIVRLQGSRNTESTKSTEQGAPADGKRPCR
jgi:hypothetical protein